MPHRHSFPRSFVWIVVSIALASACVGEDVGRQEAAVSHPGAWDIPADTAAIGDTMWVQNTQAGAWVGEDGCSGGLEPGSGELRTWLLAAFPQITSIGGYACRTIAGTSTMSVHGTGRALDVMIPVYAGDADNDLGDPIGNWLIEHAEEIGIQYIIWDRWTWDGSDPAGAKERAYTGSNPHIDHLHVELSIAGGNMETPWFSGPRTLPDSQCPALPADGGIIEETSDCFSMYGPSAYWRSVASGSAGAMLWTNAFQSATPGNWARWHLTPVAGRYEVAIYAQPEYAVHRATRYTVRHAGVDHELVVDLQGASGWVTLGTFDFDGGGAEHVSVYDHSDVAVPADQHIPVDAVRLTPETTEPMGMEPTPGPFTLIITERVWDGFAEAIAGGDPSLDDDPLPGSLEGGCSASGARRGGSVFALTLALVALVMVRRRRR